MRQRFVLRLVEVRKEWGCRPWSVWSLADDMASLDILDRSGKQVGTYEIELADLAPRINKQLLHDVVVMYQANLRQGSAKSKSRAEVSATTKKMYRQKGTGNARAGSRVSGVRRGGGHIFALRPRDYSYRLPKKAIRLATRMALAAKIRDGQVVVLDELGFEQPKAREAAGVLKAIGCAGKKVLLVSAAYDENIYKSARNIAGVKVSPAGELNALVLVDAERVVITKDALDAVKQRAAGVQQGEVAATA